MPYIALSVRRQNYLGDKDYLGLIIRGLNWIIDTVVATLNELSDLLQMIRLILNFLVELI
jgi:hypothetical protein